MHEHMYIDLSKVKDDQDCCLDCYRQTVLEMKQLYKKGVRTIWEVTNIGMGRDVDYIQDIEKETGIHFIVSTGCYKDPFITKECQEMTIQELAYLFIKEINEGIDNTGIKAKAIGEIGTSLNTWTQNEKKVFAAAVLAHKETGVPIYTHTTLGTLALEQTQFFKENQCQLDKIVIGHIDLNGDVNYIRKVLESGVNVGFDTIGKNNYLSDDKRIKFLIELEKQGYLNQIVLSEDLTRKSHLKEFGGIGYSYLFDVFLPRLKEAGMSQASIDTLLIDNPKRILG